MNDTTTITNLPAVTSETPPRLPSMQAGGQVRAIVPQDFDSAWRIAKAVTTAGMAPQGLNTPEKAMIAIMHGLEVGLTPMAALQSIAVVNGRPTIWGDGSIGLVRASGLLEWMDEKHVGTEGTDAYKAVCVVQRKGEPRPITAEFSVADARRAGLYGKTGPWQQYPRRMLQMRARGFALRDGFADVLRGLVLREEAEDYGPMKDVTPADAEEATARGRQSLDAFAAPPVAPEADAHDPETGVIVDKQPEPETRTRRTRQKATTEAAQDEAPRQEDAGETEDPAPREEPASRPAPAPAAAAQDRPETAEEYVAYARGWFAEATDPDAAVARWTAEKKMRTQLVVNLDDVTTLVAELKAKNTELRNRG